MSMNFATDLSWFTPDRLSTFLAVARRESFSAGAADVHLSQPAVSRQIAALERAVGAALFERGSRAARLTDAGRSFLPEASRVLGELARACEAIVDVKAGRAGVLRVAASSTPGFYVAPRLLGELARRMPGIDLDFVVTNSARVEEMVIENRVDLGFIGGAPVAKHVVAERLLDDHLILIAKRGHPLSHRRRVKAVDLAPETLVVREAGSSTRRMAEEWLAAARAHPRRTIELGCPEAIKAVVASGIGVGFISALGLQGEFRWQSIVALNTPRKDLRRPLWILRHAKKRLTPALSLLMDIAKADVAKSTVLAR
jgi:DNA-binding transcriptional LysR family regulator